MTESMIEQVGEAIIAALSSFKDPDLSSAIGYIMQEPLDARALELRRMIGRAAIEAMREPTEFMIDTGWKLDWGPNGGYSEDHASPLTAWQNMIDAALKWPAGSADRAGVPMARD